jgi:hypothetical protein
VTRLKFEDNAPQAMKIRSLLQDGCTSAELTEKFF